MASDKALALLESIDASLKQLVVHMRATAAAAPKPVASDRDLDGKYGNPTLRFMPRDWTGPSFKNAKFSDCPPDLLDLVAASLDYFADKADQNNEVTTGGKPKSSFNRADAARARGWAKRMREGTHTAPVSTTAPATVPTDWDQDDDGWEEATH